MVRDSLRITLFCLCTRIHDAGLNARAALIDDCDEFAHIVPSRLRHTLSDPSNFA